MQRLKWKIVLAAMAVATSPLLALPQSTQPGPSNAPNPPPSGQGELRDQETQKNRGHRRHRRRRHRRHHRRHRPRAAMLLRNPAFRERLGISPEQAERIQAQQSELEKAMTRNRAEIQVKRLELDELLTAENLDRAAVEKKLRELNDTQFAARKSALDHRLALREALTPEQREKLREMIREFRTRRMRDGSDSPGRGEDPPFLQEQRAAPPDG